MQTDTRALDVKAPTQYTIDGSNGADGKGVDGKDQPQQVDWTPKEERNAKRKYVLYGEQSTVCVLTSDLQAGLRIDAIAGAGLLLSA